MTKRRHLILACLVLLIVTLACDLLPVVELVEEPIEEPVEPSPTAASEEPPVELSPPGPLPGGLDEVDRTLFSQLQIFYRVFAESGDRIWDGHYRPDRWPLLFVRVDDGGRPIYGYLVNGSSQPADAMPLSPNPGGIPPVHRVTEGLDAFSDPHFYFDFTYPLAGMELLAVRYDGGDESPADSQWLPYVVHEGFHGFQDQTWVSPPNWDQEGAYPLDAENVALALLEHHVLLVGLEAPEAEADDALRLFVAVRGERMDRHPAVRSLDNPQEWSEGTADYLERQFTHLAGIVDMLTLEETLAEPFDVQADLVYDTFTWDRFYATGSAQGVLMDRAGIPWRPAMARGQTPYDILNAAFPLSGSERDDLLAQAKERFDYPVLLEQARQLVGDG